MQVSADADEPGLPVTLPVLDAFFADEAFAPALKAKLSLTDEQVERLRSMAREETAKLRETDADDYEGTTAAARSLASDKIKAIIGEEKTRQLSSYLRERWRGEIRWEEPMAAALSAGHASFWLEGEKLRGGWSLRHIDGRRWLLVKRRDEHADSGDPVAERPESVASGRSIDQLGQEQGGYRGGMPPRGVKKGTKRARQYEHVKESQKDQGKSESKGRGDRGAHGEQGASALGRVAHALEDFHR